MGARERRRAEGQGSRGVGELGRGGTEEKREEQGQQAFSPSIKQLPGLKG